MAHLSGKPPNFITAASFYEEAARALLAVPKRLREVKGVDEKLKTLRQTQREIAMQSIGDFVAIPIEAEDFGDEIRTIQERVSGKELTDALLVLAESWARVSRERAEAGARKSIEEFSSNRLFAKRKLTDDGRLAAKGPPASDASLTSSKPDDAIWNQMVQNYNFDISFAVQATIAPAWKQLVLEHFITDDDLVNIVALSGIVPAGRVKLVAKGLKAGFEGDFAVALHLLVPQLEHLVRSHLQIRGAKTVPIDLDQGLQREASLSTLVELAEMAEIFGDDLAFEIRALFCDGFGPNLRNELAHGLLEEGACYSATSLYAWWLIFSMIYLQYWYGARTWDNMAPPAADGP
ncbi:DUF4209 domain-containing protein [Comamonas sp. Z1]|uniref:DUF4209 domain-containing protein n=1 Tax=Comamonas sp. Z1 TaxID=2601246 RepID=UPI0011E7B190|nr:DUF4209 domain-containing protein [Comamonas sp. Z1]TYK74118.1 DUF4209 domain-containing protein [Comamonas sp. Z1]